MLGVLAIGSSPSTGQVVTGNFILNDVGPKWSIAIVNVTGVSLNSTGGNHVISYAGITLDVA
jgi:hypothetical protein